MAIRISEALDHVETDFRIFINPSRQEILLRHGDDLSDLGRRDRFDGLTEFRPCACLDFHENDNAVIRCDEVYLPYRRLVIRGEYLISFLKEIAFRALLAFRPYFASIHCQRNG